MSDPNEAYRVAEIGSLNGCLVEGDPEQRKRERQAQRRALAVSILVQAAILAALILVPLFGRTERLVFAHDPDFVPLPPLGHVGDALHPKPSQPPPSRQNEGPVFHLVFSHPTSFPPHPVTSGGNPTPGGPEGFFPDPNPVAPGGSGVPGGTGNGPAPPGGDDGAKNPRVVHRGHLDPALLIHRVEPVYPALARQLNRSGRVELHALIAVDGSIQSLQVASGDPLFYQSAVDAVQQWRYRPLSLNGQPVEIDTHITVIYTMNR